MRFQEQSEDFFASLLQKNEMYVFSGHERKALLNSLHVGSDDWCS